VKKVPIHLQSAQNRLLIKNGKIVNADEIVDNDVYIEDGIIKQIGRNLIIPGGTRTIDARGMYLLPGGIDPHTHLELELMGATSVDDFYQGTKAAIAGGTTMIIDFALPRRGESLVDTYNNWRQKADEKVCCDYALHIGVTWWSEQVSKEMEEMVKSGVNSFKVFMAYKDIYMLKDSELYEVFTRVKELGGVAMVHAENGDIVDANTKRLLAKGVTGPEGHELSRPEEVEAEATNRAAMIANQVGCPLYVVHVMSESAAATIARLREEGGRETMLFGETLAAALGTTQPELGCCWEHAASHVLSPPLRPKKTTPETLMKYLASDGLQLTGSDNCTFTIEQKKLGVGDFSKIPNGVNGVEDRMSVVWEKGVAAGIIDPCRFVAITSTNAAKVFNLYPRKGCIAVGSDADIVVWNHQKTRVISAKTHHQALDTNIFEGMECHGVPEYVIVNGRVCVDEGDLKVVQGYGRFVPCAPYPPIIYVEEAAAAAAKEELEKLAVTENGRSSRASINGDSASVRGRSPALSCSASVFGDDNPAPFHSGKGMRLEGQRNLQDSTFSISAEMDESGRRSCIRVKNPPGGQSSGNFW